MAIGPADRFRAPILFIQVRNDLCTRARPIEVCEVGMRALGRRIEVHWFDDGHMGPFAQVEQAIERQKEMLGFSLGVLRRLGWIHSVDEGLYGCLRSPQQVGLVLVYLDTAIGVVSWPHQALLLGPMLAYLFSLRSLRLRGEPRTDFSRLENKEEKRMNTVELLQHSLGNAFGILGQVMADVTQEQADWQPPGTANPIGATYWHTLSGADDVVYRWALGQEPLRQRDGWDDRVLSVSVPEPEHGGDLQAYMRAIRVDLPVLHEYAMAVAETLQGWLGSLAPEDLERVINTPIGENTLAQMLDVFIIWHINAHCGEISALKGCQGAKGYPF